MGYPNSPEGNPPSPLWFRCPWPLTIQCDAVHVFTPSILRRYLKTSTDKSLAKDRLHRRFKDGVVFQLTDHWYHILKESGSVLKYILEKRSILKYPPIQSNFPSFLTVRVNEFTYIRGGILDFFVTKSVEGQEVNFSIHLVLIHNA